MRLALCAPPSPAWAAADNHRRGAAPTTIGNQAGNRPVNSGNVTNTEMSFHISPRPG